MIIIMEDVKYLYLYLYLCVLAFQINQIMRKNLKCFNSLMLRLICFWLLRGAEQISVPKKVNPKDYLLLSEFVI